MQIVGCYYNKRHMENKQNNIKYEQLLNGTIYEQNKGIKFVLEYEEK